LDVSADYDILLKLLFLVSMAINTNIRCNTSNSSRVFSL
jgi:hypothetical protein